MFKKTRVKKVADDSEQTESRRERQVQETTEQETDADLREIAWTIWMEKRGRRF